VQNVSGFTLDTCSLVKEAGIQYVKMKFGSVASNTIKFGLQALDCSCKSSDIKTFAFELLEANGYNEAKDAIIVFFLIWIINF